MVDTKRHDRTCVNSRSATKEQARRLGKAGRIFRELLGSRHTNGKEILTIGEGKNKEYICTADTVHRALSGLFDKHFRAGRTKWYRRTKTHPLFRMDDEGKTYRGGVSTEPRTRPNCQRTRGNPLQPSKQRRWTESHSPPTSTRGSSRRRTGTSFSPRNRSRQATGRTPRNGRRREIVELQPIC